LQAAGKKAGRMAMTDTGTEVTTLVTAGYRP
jgi:hypothetical protein